MLPLPLTVVEPAPPDPCGSAATGAPPVHVDVAACARLAELLASRPIPPDKEDSTLPDFDRLEIGNYYLFLVAICHQTSPRGEPPLEGFVAGRRRRGWDYLTAKLEAAARADRSLLGPRRWARMTVSELGGLIEDPELPGRLRDPGFRASLVRDLGEVMLRRGWRWLEDLYELCGGRAATGAPNLFGLLSEFKAYRDPVRKKSSFLLALMKNTGLWEYVDAEKVGPPVDYHEVRGHLRLGTVVVTDPALRRRLREGAPVTAEEDVAIRRAVYDAIMLLSERSGLRNPSQLHYLFWNVFRTHCRRDDPLCFEDASALPERYRHLQVWGGTRRQCPFAAVCASAGASDLYSEHVFETDYY